MMRSTRLSAPQPQSARLARNTMLSLAGGLGPAVVGVLTIPYVVRGLGPDAFGVIALVWVAIGMFALLDLGTGRAVTRFVAEYLVRGEPHRIPSLFWTALSINAAVGIVTGIVLAAAAPVLVLQVLKVPSALQQDAIATFRILALFLPGFVLTVVVRSALEGAQRFELTSAVQFLASSANFLVPAIVIFAGGDLPGVMLWLCVSRVLAALAFLVLCLRQFPALRVVRGFHASSARTLLQYGGWLTISNVIAPFLLHLDRILLGGLVGVQAVALYAAPYELVTRLTLIPASMMLAFFPAFTACAVTPDERLGETFRRAVRQVALLMTPVCLIFAVFAGDILHLWLGQDFAGQSALATRILAIGVLLLSLSSVPFNLLQAAGRPELVAAIHVLELPLYATLSWILVRNFGIVGAATAWTARTLLDMVLFHGVTWHILAQRTGVTRGVRRLPTAGEPFAGVQS
jgi:O-antigen/teichoic acid export membrane protein